MVNTLLARASSAIDWTSDGYRPAPRPMAVLRICFALYVLIWPRDIAWIGEMSAVAFYPPPGPFALLTGPAPAGVLTALSILRAAIAIWVLIGWRTRVASAVLSAVLIVCSGLAYSFGKVDHLILYDLTPLMLGLAGWGSAWSVDAIRRKAAPMSGYAMFVFGTLIAFAICTAAAAKAASGWLAPARLASRYFVASDVEYTVTRMGSLASWVLQFDSTILWKFLDYSTLFVEGWLVVAVFFPGLFRIGLLMLGAFHIGVWLTLGISFQLYAFVYIGFFLLPLRHWFPEISQVRNLLNRRRVGLEPSPKPLS